VIKITQKMVNLLKKNFIILFILCQLFAKNAHSLDRNLNEEQKGTECKKLKNVEDFKKTMLSVINPTGNLCCNKQEC
jgi:hypothetical protein